MYTVSFRFSLKKVAVYVAAAAVVGGGVWLAGTLLSHRGSAPQAPAQATATGVSTNDARRDYLVALGWEISPEPVEIEEVLIPAEFDQVYQRYNELQKQQGFDLERFRGQRVKRYSYDIANYPGHSEHIRANLLVCDYRIIGGDVCCTELGGFMQGLQYQAATVSTQTA